MKLITILIGNCVFLISSDYYSQNGHYVQASPKEALQITSQKGYTLPSPALVQSISDQATCKPILMPKNPASLEAVTLQAQEAQYQVSQCKNQKLISGSFKDIVVAPSGVLGLFGWNRLGGGFIQPLYTGHSYEYKDYSQSFRFIHPKKLCKVNNTWVFKEVHSNEFK